MLPRRVSLWFCLGCLGFNLWQNAVGRIDIAHSVTYALLNEGLSLGAAVLIRMFCGAATDLSRVRRLFTFAIIVVATATAEALIGQTICSLIFGDRVDFISTFLQWIGEDSLGVLIAAPAVLLPLKSRRAVYASGARP